MFELVESEDEISSAKSVRSELTIEIRSRANSVEILSSSSSDFESGIQPRTYSIGPASGMINNHSIKPGNINPSVQKSPRLKVFRLFS